MEQTLFNHITKEEQEMMDWYRDNFSGAYASASEDKAELKEILQPWEDNKGDLFKLLGNNLIISKEVSYKKSNEELVENFEERLYSYDENGERKPRNGKQFYDAFFEFQVKNFPYFFSPFDNDWEPTAPAKANEKNLQQIRDGLNKLMDLNTLVKGYYEGETFSIILPNGKELKINNGCKAMRALSKIAAAYDLPGFEDFRITQSLVTNQANLTGYITLSIHPLDYMTMSDNNCGWDSCMSWQEEGCYRQGTVEMMNSPYVVVAYLSSSNDMYIGDYKWNSKKWRELFIVNKDLIMAIKDYPYHNQDLSLIVVDWLKELAEKNMNWHYPGGPFKYGEDKVSTFRSSGRDYQLRFYTNMMYNDVFATDYHWLCISATLPEQCDINYSGATECVWCGITGGDNFGSESQLVCNTHENSVYCAECGERINDVDEAYCVNGRYYCECCYNDIFTACSECDDDIPDEDINRIVAFIESPTDKKTWYIVNYIYNVCDDCLDDWFNRYLISNKYYMYDEDDNYFYVNLKDVKEEGLSDVLNYSMRYDYLDVLNGECSLEDFINSYEPSGTLYKSVAENFIEKEI